MEGMKTFYLNLRPPIKLKNGKLAFTLYAETEELARQEAYKSSDDKDWLDEELTDCTELQIDPNKIENNKELITELMLRELRKNINFN